MNAAIEGMRFIIREPLKRHDVSSPDVVVPASRLYAAHPS